MKENGIEISIPQTNTNYVGKIISLLEDCGYASLVLPKILSPRIIATRIQNAEILVIEKGDTNKIFIGIVVVSEIQEWNEFGSFVVVFDAKADTETISASIRLFKEYYLSKGLSKITVKLPADEKIISKIIMADGFSEEIALQSQIKTPEGFQPIRLFTATINGRQMISATEITVSRKKTEVTKDLQEFVQNLRTQLEKTALELQKVKNAKMLAEDNLARANAEITLKIEEIKGLRGSLAGVSETEKDQKIRELKSEVESLKKEATDEKEQRVKLKEWLDKKREELKIAEEKNRLLETELEESKNEALEKKIPEETTLRRTEKLGDTAIKMLREVINYKEGVTQKEIVAKTGIQQGTVSYNVTKVLFPAGLIIKVPTGKKRTKIAPNLEKIRQLPKELRKELGIQIPVEEIKIPVAELREPAAEIKEPETTEKPEEKSEKLLPVTRKETGKTIDSLTPFRVVTAILKEHINNGGGIDIQELQRIAVEKGLSKDEAASSIKALKRGHILTAWGNNPYHQINKEELAKIN